MHYSKLESRTNMTGLGGAEERSGGYFVASRLRDRKHVCALPIKTLSCRDNGQPERAAAPQGESLRRVLRLLRGHCRLHYRRGISCVLRLQEVHKDARAAPAGSRRSAQH